MVTKTIQLKKKLKKFGDAISDSLLHVSLIFSCPYSRMQYWVYEGCFTDNNTKLFSLTGIC